MEHQRDLVLGAHQASALHATAPTRRPPRAYDRTQASVCRHSASSKSTSTAEGPGGLPRRIVNSVGSSTVTRTSTSSVVFLRLFGVPRLRSPRARSKGTWQAIGQAWGLG